MYRTCVELAGLYARASVGADEPQRVRLPECDKLAFGVDPRVTGAPGLPTLAVSPSPALCDRSGEEGETDPRASASLVKDERLASSDRLGEAACSQIQRTRTQDAKTRTTPPSRDRRHRCLRRLSLNRSKVIRVANRVLTPSPGPATEAQHNGGQVSMPNVPSRRALVGGSAACFLVLMLVGSAARAATVPPASLAGEFLYAQTDLAQPFPELGAVTVTSRACNADGSGTVSFVATGPASGPYPGTFSERGTVSFGPRLSGSQFSNVTRATTGFVIKSPTGLVAGANRFSGAAQVDCLDIPGFISTLPAAPQSYSAVISTPSGAFYTTGQATTYLHGPGAVFSASFATSSTPVAIGERGN